MIITAEPRSDQWNADDFTSGPRTFTIAGVKDGTAEQKYDIALEGEARAWRPPLTQLRVLLAAWGDDSNVWVGRRVTLYQDPTVRFGKEVPGGVRISHLSHIDKPKNFKVTTTRSKRETITVQPLPAVAPVPEPTTHTWEELADKAAGDNEALRRLWDSAQTQGAPVETLDYIKSKAVA